MLESMAILKISAILNPKVRVLGWSSFGNRLVTIDIKTILSTPRTISRNVSVNKAIQASPVKNISIFA
jgi:hypothetical protein